MASSDELASQFEDLSVEERWLKCTICREYYDEPRTLPCSHNFCIECLVQLRESSNACPECRRECDTPVLQLPVNLAVKTLAAEKKHQEEIVATFMAARRHSIPAPVHFTVNVKDLHGKIHRVRGIRAETLLSELKVKFYELTGMPIEHQRLIFSGKPLDEDDKDMKHYGIGKNKTIHAVFRIKGGGCILAEIGF